MGIGGIQQRPIYIAAQTSADAGGYIPPSARGVIVVAQPPQYSQYPQYSSYAQQQQYRGSSDVSFWNFINGIGDLALKGVEIGLVGGIIYLGAKLLQGVNPIQAAKEGYKWVSSKADEHVSKLETERQSDRIDSIMSGKWHTFSKDVYSGIAGTKETIISSIEEKHKIAARKGIGEKLEKELFEEIIEASNNSGVLVGKDKRKYVCLVFNTAEKGKIEIVIAAPNKDFLEVTPSNQELALTMINDSVKDVLTHQVTVSKEEKSAGLNTETLDNFIQSLENQSVGFVQGKYLDPNSERVRKENLIEKGRLGDVKIFDVYRFTYDLNPSTEASGT